MNTTKRKVPPHLHILKLSFSFFASGMLLFLIGMVAAIWFIPDLIQFESFRNSMGWFLAHVFLLGWATMVAMGASYQITQIVLVTSLYSRTIGYIHFFCYLVGFIGLVSGFFINMKLIVLGGSFIVIGGFLYVFNLCMTFIRKRIWNVFVFGVTLSLTAFLMTIFLGIAMGLGYGYGVDVEKYEAVFKSHMWMGIAGWLSGLIIVYSFKLLPMFYVSTKKVTTSSYWIIGFYHIAVWLHVVSFWNSLNWLANLGTFFIMGAIGWFVFYIFQVRKYRRGKLPIGTVRVAFYLIPIMYFLFLLSNITDAFQEEFIIILILGWFSSSILSYLYKIIPFLWWPYRYRTKEDRKTAVLLYEMLPGNRMTLELCVYLLGITVLVIGFVFKFTLVAVLGQILAVSCVIIYIVELLKVFRY
ncbi:cbb3-type cytochrome c oxidase subunit I [Lederbergia panacisoli]|uniref:cbb3-type cytochrome c oxidase subunit I n=1 Tax=Lederbergia panacisoli TaxID=1255251 RepID=UPI00214CFD51|nr:cbb3-type cytochrome c oxidase subunit I [Lederbergia panacisoli]MCR2822543.1 cbb3-type cytochrome c oxidase subunit I [Lederbergia panacisoli]